jgi:dTDP-4-amino-4,6-dideoxygalactose transaminase
MNGKHFLNDLALFGGKPLFDDLLHVGQLNFPKWQRFKDEMQGIFDRRFFTNNGPKVRELETKLAERLGIGHAICMTNGTIALMVAAKALGLTGEVIVPAFTFIATAQSLIWSGLDPVFCDVDPDTHNISAQLAEPLITDQTSAILGVHLWGRPCDISGLTSLTEKNGMRLFYDAAHAVGCSHKNHMIGNFGDIEVFSMHATKVLNASEGGFVTTNDDRLADIIRTIRNFHSTETFVKTPLRINAKMSEAQAVMGLLSLEDLPVNCEANRQRYYAFLRNLSGLPGLTLIRFNEEESNNFQYIVVDVDKKEAGLSRNDLVRLLEGENVIARRYFTPGAHRTPPFAKRYPQYLNKLAVTDSLSERLMQLPNGQAVILEDVEKMCAFIAFCLENATAISSRLAN